MMSFLGGGCVARNAASSGASIADVPRATAYQVHLQNRLRVAPQAPWQLWCWLAQARALRLQVVQCAAIARLLDLPHGKKHPRVLGRKQEARWHLRIQTSVLDASREKMERCRSSGCALQRIDAQAVQHGLRDERTTCMRGGPVAKHLKLHSSQWHSTWAVVCGGAARTAAYPRWIWR